MRRAEFALGHGAVAALGSRYHEHLLQDTHCRAVPPCCTPKSTQISPKCQTPAAGGGSSPIPPPCLRDVVQHQQTLPWGISLRAGNRALEQLIASKESSNTARISPRGTRAAVGALLKSNGAPAPIRLAEPSPARRPREGKPEPSFYPGVQSPILSACPAGVSGRITMEQLLIHLGQPQRCLMATPVMAGVSRGYGIPSGAGPSEALSFLPLVAPSWDLGCSHPSWQGRTPWKTI